MPYKDIVDFLYNKKEDEELFNLEDAEREEIKKKSSKMYEKIISFIDSRVHPKSRKELENLLLEYDNAECEYLRKEMKLLYKNGFCDGIKLIVYGLSKN